MSADPTRLEVYCLDVGQGDCTVILPPAGEGAPILFDCADPYVAERFFANHGMTRLGAVVVSHLDIDHIRGVLPFLKSHFAAKREVGLLHLAIDRDRAKIGAAATELIDAALQWDRDKPHPGFSLCPPFRSSAPETIASGPDWKVELVLPFYGTALQAQADGDEPNLASAVLRVERAGTAILIGADAPLGSWERLDAAVRRAVAIRTPHHGGDIDEGRDAFTEPAHLYNAVGAEVAVVSVGTTNTYKHPHGGHLAAMRRGGACRVCCTQMTPRCEADPTKVRADALAVASTLEWPYRHRAVPGYPSPQRAKEVPCAGTVLLSLNAAGKLTVSPSQKAHGELIDFLATPLCRA